MSVRNKRSTSITHLRCDCLFVSVYNLVKVSAPDLDTVHVAWRDMAEDVNLLPVKLSHLIRSDVKVGSVSVFVT